MRSDWAAMAPDDVCISVVRLEDWNKQHFWSGDLFIRQMNLLEAAIFVHAGVQEFTLLMHNYIIEMQMLHNGWHVTVLIMLSAASWAKYRIFPHVRHLLISSFVPEKAQKAVFASPWISHRLSSSLRNSFFFPKSIISPSLRRLFTPPFCFWVHCGLSNA